jgi:hypothetical protein
MMRALDSKTDSFAVILLSNSEEEKENADSDQENRREGAGYIDHFDFGVSAVNPRLSATG